MHQYCYRDSRIKNHSHLTLDQLLCFSVQMIQIQMTRPNNRGSVSEGARRRYLYQVSLINMTMDSRPGWKGGMSIWPGHCAGPGVGRPRRYIRESAKQTMTKPNCNFHQLMKVQLSPSNKNKYKLLLCSLLSVSPWDRPWEWDYDSSAERERWHKDWAWLAQRGARGAGHWGGIKAGHYRHYRHYIRLITWTCRASHWLSQPTHFSSEIESIIRSWWLGIF